MDDETIKKMSDEEMISMMLATMTLRRIGGEEKEEEKVVCERMRHLLSRAAENLAKVDSLMKKLIDANDNLAMERSSNKRMRALLADLAGVLHGDPRLYPPPLNDLVARVQKEFKS